LIGELVKIKSFPDEWLPTRLSLLTRLKHWDDQDGWQQFFDTYWRLLYGVARQAGLTDAEAQDVVQIVVIEVAAKMRDGKFIYRADGSFKAWLLTLTQWRVTDQFRRRQSAGARLHQQEGKTKLMEEVADDRVQERIAASWDAEWENNLLQQALDKVKPRVAARTFQIFQLHVQKEWSVPKVMETLGVGRAQVYMAKLRVSNLVKKELAKLKKKSG